LQAFAFATILRCLILDPKIVKNTFDQAACYFFVKRKEAAYKICHIKEGSLTASSWDTNTNTHKHTKLNTLSSKSERHFLTDFVQIL